MADEVDVANDLRERELGLALSKLRQNADKEMNGSKKCLECGEDIPTARQKLGFKLCVACASESERRRSLFVDD